MSRKVPLPVFLPGRFVSHWARYLRDIQDLTLEGTVEPRKWIGCAERFWVEVAEDTGDWLTEIGGDGGMRVRRSTTPTILPAGDRSLEISIEVPSAAFEALEAEELRLRPDSLFHGPVAVAVPGRNLAFRQPHVTRDNRFAELYLFELPAFVPGMKLRGTVWAEPATQPVDSTPVGSAEKNRNALPVAIVWICVS